MSQSDDFARLGDFEGARNDLTAMRRHLHAHPELSCEERETAAFVAGKLEGWGYEVTRGVGGHGVVARLASGSGTRSLAIRADMDALPITEATGLPYASRVPGRMHACGHDGHTTMLLGAVEYLARTRRFSGTLNLIFQPAEELVGPAGVSTCALIPGSEDFSYVLEHKPGSFLRLGNGVASAMLHNAAYDFADASLTTGAALWARLTERYLQ